MGRIDNGHDTTITLLNGSRGHRPAEDDDLSRGFAEADLL
jgi:hypothetical protein